MYSDERPNPEDLLKSIVKQENKRTKGKLKIFLGMAAGVGKTYAMLEAAQKLQKEGVYVVVGVINTHGRLETAKLLEGLPIIPEIKIKYKDNIFEELDLDAILKCKPQLVLVDELAHSNIPGSRHPKRWQDVLELLDNGINVYTTLNVQHIESLKDVIEKITGITIRETVPDSVIDLASSIELLDLSPDDLLVRLREGKVYLGDQSIIAARNFFQEDKLTALREIVLRYTAEKVEHDLQGMVSTVERSDGWKLREKLLVAVSHSPHSQKLIRITRRLAFNLDAPWIAVHVDTGKSLSKEEEEVLAKNLTLARDLGAEVITTKDSDLPRAIQRIARQKSVTQIIIGRTPHRWFWDLFSPNTLMDRLAHECSDIDLHVIRQTLFSKIHKNKSGWFKFSDPFSTYLSITAIVLLLSVFSWFFLSLVSYRIVGFTFLLGILCLSLFYRKGPVLFASILYAVIWGVFFLPEESPNRDIREDIVLLFFYLLTAIFTGILIDRERKHKDVLEQRERSLETLYEIVREIANASSLKDALDPIKNGLSNAIGGKNEIILKDINDGLIFDESNPLWKDEKEKAAANWVFHNGKEAGWSTSTLPFAQRLYIPLKGLREVVGVLAYHSKNERELSIGEKNFIYTISHQLANFIEKSFSEERTRSHEQHKQAEKTYEGIFHLISDLFEGPLMDIQDGLKDLKSVDFQDKENKVEPIIERMTISSESLSKILENITAMVNLHSGLIPINRQLHDLRKLLENEYAKIKREITDYQWALDVEENLPKIFFDYDLIELSFYNMSFHAMEFSPPDSKIEISAKKIGDFVAFSISSEGQSIPEEVVDVAFEKLYRIIPQTNPNGLGLGLAIAKTIAEIHNGQFRIQNRDEGGMSFIFFLPLEQ